VFIGVVCSYQIQVHPSYIRLLKVDMFLQATDVYWYYGTGYPTSQYAFVFKGVVAHEFGHLVRLKDLPPGSAPACVDPPTSSVWTMCQAGYNEVFFNPRDGSYWRQTVESDDTSSANAVY
jgi:hypothetical protein